MAEYDPSRMAKLAGQLSAKLYGFGRWRRSLLLEAISVSLTASSQGKAGLLAQDQPCPFKPLTYAYGATTDFRQ